MITMTFSFSVGSFVVVVITDQAIARTMCGTLLLVPLPSSRNKAERSFELSSQATPLLLQSTHLCSVWVPGIKVVFIRT